MAIRLSIPAAPKFSAMVRQSVPKFTMAKPPKAPKPFMPRNRRFNPAPNKRNF